MIDRARKLSVVRQCQQLNLFRLTTYYYPTLVPLEDLAVMRQIGELFRSEGGAIGWRVASLMRRMGITAVYRTPHDSQQYAAHRICPYLLCGLDIVRPNRVWAADIT